MHREGVQNQDLAVLKCRVPVRERIGLLGRMAQDQRAGDPAVDIGDPKGLFLNSRSGVFPCRIDALPPAALIRVAFQMAAYGVVQGGDFLNIRV